MKPAGEGSRGLLQELRPHLGDIVASAKGSTTIAEEDSDFCSGWGCESD
jgi:hypothetical protein